MRRGRTSPHWTGILARILVGLLIAGLPMKAAPAVASGWQEIRSEDGIRIYRRDLPGSQLVSFKGVGIVDAPVDRLMSVILDTDRMPEWVTSLREVRVVDWIDRPNAFVLYYWMDLPWPVRDREFVSDVTVSVDPRTHVTRVDYATSSRAVATTGKILGALGGSYYVLEPLGDGARTLVTGVVVADPRGRVPPWIVNLFERSWPHELITDLREQSARPDIRILHDVERLYAPAGSAR